MELITYSKCACANCGHVIEYASWQAGKEIVCAQCKERSILPEQPKLMVMGVCGPPTPDFRDCPACGTQMKFWTRVCPACETARQRKAFITRVGVYVGVAALVIVASVVANLVVRQHIQAAREKAYVAAHTIPSGSTILIEQPRPRLPKSGADLQPGHFYLEQRHGSDLIIAVGDIQNVSDNLHRGLRADVDVLDKSGAKIGSVKDYSSELPPHQSWRFLATVTQTNAASIRFVGIKEEQ